MTDRYARQTYKNLLSGMGGGALIGYQPTSTSGGDENAQQIIHNAKTINLKTGNGQSGASLIASSTTTTTTTSSSTNLNINSNTMSSTTITSEQHTIDGIASIRNALGDIGNRLTNAHYVAAAAAVAANKKEMITTTNKMSSVVPIRETTQQTTQQQQSVMPMIVSKPVETESVVVVEASSNNNNNNSCIMIEEDDEDEIEEDEDVVLEESIADIDEFDSDNTQLASEYVKDIYKYLSQVEKSNRISPSFLENKIVTTKMRAVLIDWLIQVHLKFHLLQETLYLCVQIIDAYLMAMDVPKMQLQLVGVTAMFVASKYEEMYVPAIDDFVYMTDNTYTKSEIRQMEISILKTLNFMFCKPLPLHFLRRFSKAGQADPKQHTLAKYFMELSLHDAEFSSMDPSYLAACSMCLSFKLLHGSYWNRTIEYYTTYKQASLYPGMQKIAKLVLKASDLDYKYRAVTNKYGASKLMRISTLPELSGAVIKQLASGGLNPNP